MEAYPLQWPQGKLRTQYPKRSIFRTQPSHALKFIQGEVRRLGGTNLVISTNIPLKKDGFPYATYRTPDDKGVAIYFSYKGKQMCFACDRWDIIHDNIYAIGKTIEALRGVERWGTGEMVAQAFTGFTALPSPNDPYCILGIKPGASVDEIDSAYKQRAKAAHPDSGGSVEAMQALNEARKKLKGAA